jgi:hypothetical protein
MNRTIAALAALAAAPALALGLASPALAGTPTSTQPIQPVITGFAHTDKLQSGGVAVALRISYQCDPASTQRNMTVTFSQVIRGRIFRQITYWSPQFCTGLVQTSTVHVYQTPNKPAWHTGPAVASAYIFTFNYSDGFDPNGYWIFSPEVARNVTIVR